MRPPRVEVSQATVGSFCGAAAWKIAGDSRLPECTSTDVGCWHMVGDLLPCFIHP